MISRLTNSLQDNERAAINAAKFTLLVPLVRYAYGGKFKRKRHKYDGLSEPTGNMNEEDPYKDINIDWRALDNNLLYILPEADSIPNDIMSLVEYGVKPASVGRNFLPFVVEPSDDPAVRTLLENAVKRRMPLYRTSLNAQDNLETSDYNCLGSTLNWDSRKIGLYGMEPLRETTKNFWLPTFEGGRYLIPQRDGWSGNFEKSIAPSSWNYARAMDAAGYGLAIPIPLDLEFSYLNYPVGTIFHTGNAAGHYIPESYKKDENGVPYPAHSIMLTGFAKDPESGNIHPILNDYGGLDLDVDHLYGENQHPQYAFIRKGALDENGQIRPEYTGPELMKGYERYLNTLRNVNPELYQLQGLDRTNAQFLSNIDLNELFELNRRYGITGDLAALILLRLMAIGAQESELGYTLNTDKPVTIENVYNTLTGNAEGGWGSLKSMGRSMLHNLPDEAKTLIKSIVRNPNGARSPEDYDEMAGWQREIEVFNDLMKSGAFKNKTQELVLQLVKDEYNKRSEAFKNDNYGKKMPHYTEEENANNSHGAFLMKALPDSYKYDSEGNPIKGSRFNIDDLYAGKNETLKAYNRFAYMLLSLKESYPELSMEELIDAATVGWNAPSKISNLDFIDFYIKNLSLPDSYLNKIRTHQLNLYKDRAIGRFAKGGHLFGGELKGTSLISIRPNNTVLYVGNTEDENGEYTPTYVLPNTNVSPVGLSPSLIMRTDNIGFQQGYYPIATPEEKVPYSPSIFTRATGFDPEAKDVVGMLPYAGDAVDIYDMALDIEGGNYGLAALGLGALLIPNAAEGIYKSVKPGIKKAVNRFRQAMEGVADVPLETKETMEDILKKTSHHSMPIGHAENAVNIKEAMPAGMLEAYDRVMAKPLSERTLTDEKVISDYNAIMSSANSDHFRPGYQSRIQRELDNGLAPINGRSLTAVALDLNVPYKKGQLLDGWFLDETGKPYFDQERWIAERLEDPEKFGIDYINVAGDTELNPMSYMLYLLALLKALREGKVMLEPVKNPDGTYFMLRLNNWNASKEEPARKARKGENIEDVPKATIERKKHKQDVALLKDSALIQGMRGLLSMPDIPLPARVKGLGNSPDDDFMFPAFSAVRVDENGEPIKKVIDESSLKKRWESQRGRGRFSGRFRAEGGDLTDSDLATARELVSSALELTPGIGLFMNAGNIANDLYNGRPVKQSEVMDIVGATIKNPYLLIPDLINDTYDAGLTVFHYPDMPEQIRDFIENPIPVSTTNSGKTVSKKWLDLSMKEKAVAIRSAVKNHHANGGSLTDISIDDIKHRFDEGGEEDIDVGGYTMKSLPEREKVAKQYDPTSRFDVISWGLNGLANQIDGEANIARGDANEYWRAYLGLDNRVPEMNPLAYTEWDKKIEDEKRTRGETVSDFYGTTNNMDRAIQLMADTLTLGQLSRNFDPELAHKLHIPSQRKAQEFYTNAKKVMDNPDQWQLMNGNDFMSHYDKETHEADPLGMLEQFGMKWSPSDKALYIHDTYDFPWYAHYITDIPKRPIEMKIRGKVGFDPKKGSKVAKEAKHR